MRRFLDVLHLPSGLTEELAENALTSATLLAAALLTAWLVGRLAARWMRNASGRRATSVNEETARSLAWNLSMFIALIGVYLAVEALGVRDRALGVVGAITYVIAALLALRLATRVVGVMWRSYFEHHATGPTRERAEREYLPLAQTGSTVVIVLFAAITVAHHFGHEVTSLVTALGVGSLAIGLAAQATLGNMVAGFTLIIDRPFRPGDRIKLATGEVGEVQDIGIRSTRIRLADDNLLIVPNTELANSRVVNFAFPTSRLRGEVRVKVPMAEVEQSSALLLETARRESGVAPEPPPTVTLAAFDDAERAELVLHFRIDDPHAQSTIEDHIRRAVARARAARTQDAADPGA